MPCTISVIIPAYNQAAFIGQAIDSVLAQIYLPYEIIVVNDGSTDETSHVLSRYHQQVQVINQVNQGLSAARNRGINAARGEVIAFLDSDDVWHSDWLDSVVSLMQKDPELDVVCGGWEEIDELSNLIKSNVHSFSSYALDGVRKDFLRTILVGNFTLPSATVVKRHCFECCGLFDSNCSEVGDWDLLIRLAIHGHQIGLINRPVMSYRRHRNAMTYDGQRMENASRVAISKTFSTPYVFNHAAYLMPHTYIFAWLSIAGFAQKAGSKATACKYVKMAEGIYGDASSVPDLNLIYLEKLFGLPETESFMQKIAISTPSARPLFTWLMVRKKIAGKEYISAFTKIFQLTVRYPHWLCQKIFRRINRDITQILNQQA